jgi:uncharacterized membrane protein
MLTVVLGLRLLFTAAAMALVVWLLVAGYPLAALVAVPVAAVLLRRVVAARVRG